MAARSISDKAIAKLTSATLYGLDSVEVTSSQEYVLSLVRALPWFSRIPIRVTAVCAEYSSLPIYLRRFSALDDATCQRFVRRILDKVPIFPVLHRFVRTFALMHYGDRLVERITVEDMLELARLVTKVMHTRLPVRSLDFAGKYGASAERATHD